MGDPLEPPPMRGGFGCVRACIEFGARRNLNIAARVRFGVGSGFGRPTPKKHLVSNPTLGLGSQIINQSLVKQEHKGMCDSRYIQVNPNLYKTQIHCHSWSRISNTERSWSKLYSRTFYFNIYNKQWACPPPSRPLHPMHFCLYSGSKAAYLSGVSF